MTREFDVHGEDVGGHRRAAEPIRREPAAAETAASSSITAADARKVAIGALVGNAMEWYDFFLFNTAAALVFNVQYFHSGDPATAAMASFATLAVGFIVRPIGGFIFGAMGDRLGRRVVLLTTVTGIGVATALIGFLPTYAQIGVWAPLLLVILRVCQGLFVGGEWSGAMTIAVEHAPIESRARFAALPQIGSPIGTILSSGAFALLTVGLSREDFAAWGWRVPFWAAIVLLGLAVWIRTRLEESPVFLALEQRGQKAGNPLGVLFREQWRQVLAGIGVALLGVGGFYLVTTFVVSYGTRTLKLPPGLMLLGTLLGAAVEIGILVHSGRLGERLGPQRVILGSCLGSAIIAFPVFLLISSKQPALVLLGMVVSVCTLSYAYGASGAVMTALFPPETRFSGAALSQNGAGVLSGLVPLGATAMVAGAHGAWWPAPTLLILIAALTALAAWKAPGLTPAQ